MVNWSCRLLSRIRQLGWRLQVVGYTSGQEFADAIDFVSGNVS